MQKQKPLHYIKVLAYDGSKNLVRILTRTGEVTIPVCQYQPTLSKLVKH